jgi:kynurenine formamidase
LKATLPERILIRRDDIRNNKHTGGNLRDHGRGSRGRAEEAKHNAAAGDAVIINTGCGKLWAKDNARYVKSCPGIGVKAAEWLIAKDPMLLGSDNWPVEVAPNPDAQVSLPVHQIALVVNGVHLLENLKLDELAAKGVYEFAFIMEPLKIQGGSGSTVAPIAVR